MNFVLYGILLGEVVIGTFGDVIGKALSSELGILLFAAMAAVAFPIGQSLFKDYRKTVQSDLLHSRLVHILSKAIPFILYADLAIIVTVVVQMVFLSSYTVYLLIVITLLSGTAGCLLLGFRLYKFLSWYRTNRRNIMVLAFTIETILLTTGMVSTVILNPVQLAKRPASITSQLIVNLDPATFLSPTENIINSYGYVIPVIAYVIPEMIGVAFFLRYFIDKLGRKRFWTIVTLPPLLLIASTLVPQLFVSGGHFAYLEPQFASFRIIGTLGWVSGSFVMAYAYLSVAKTTRQASVRSNTLNNYLMAAAFAQILIPLTANDILMVSIYPPFGSTLYSFFVLSAFLFSTGIYSAALSISQDAKLREAIRKYGKESASLLDTIGTAQMITTIQDRVLHMVKSQAADMSKESGVESSITDAEVKEYLKRVVEEVAARKTG